MNDNDFFASDTEHRRRLMYQRVSNLLQGLVLIPFGAYLSYTTLHAFTEHPTLMVGKFHAIPLDYREHPGMYLFSATVTGVGGVLGLLYGALNLFKGLTGSR